MIRNIYIYIYIYIFSVTLSFAPKRSSDGTLFRLTSACVDKICLDNYQRVSVKYVKIKL